MSITVRQLFYGAYREAGQVLLEQTGLSQDQEEECRQVYNSFVDGLRLDGLTVSHVARTPFPITAGTGSYTIGPTGVWITDRPVRIERASVILTGITPHPEYPMDKLSLEEWQEWRLKDLSITWPSSYYYDPTPTNGTIYLLYVPSATNQVVLYLEVPISQIAVASGSPPDYSAVTLDYEPGYQAMIETNLAKAIARRTPGSRISQLTLQEADQTLRAIKIANFRPTKRRSDYPTSGPVLHDGYGSRRY